MSTLAALHRAQLSTKDKRLFDRDNDGIGEFATGEQLRIQKLWDDDVPLDGTPTRRGYRFLIRVSMDIATAERLWHCIAWPEKRGKTSSVDYMRSYLIDQAGELFEITEGEFSGPTIPSPADIFEKGDADSGVLSKRCVKVNQK